MERKELIQQYKGREQIGGIYAIKNLKLDKWYVDCAADLKGIKNRFEFFGSTHLKVAPDYQAQKGEGFVFEALEELKKGEAQTDKEFKEDLALLKEMWLEKLSEQSMY
ncbi:MAG: GIY-YIG nuclease family protein [Oscillospiraceae bacterium]|jgi:hypothetical protein|nr:GIY-YIG nuclease family protein [Oscillospiraceae bacterium]